MLFVAVDGHDSRVEADAALGERVRQAGENGRQVVNVDFVSVVADGVLRWAEGWAGEGGGAMRRPDKIAMWSCVAIVCVGLPLSLLAFRRDRVRLRECREAGGQQVYDGKCWREVEPKR